MGNVLLLLLPLTLLAPADGAMQPMTVDDLDDDDIEAMFEELVDQAEATQAELRKISHLLGKLLEERGGEKRKVARKKAVQVQDGCSVCQKKKPKKVAINRAEAPREFLVELLRDVEVQRPGLGGCEDCPKKGACSLKASCGPCGPQGKCDGTGMCGPRKVQIRKVGGCGPCGPCGPQGQCGTRSQCDTCPQKGACGPKGGGRPCCPPPPKPGKVQYMKMGPGAHKELQVFPAPPKAAGKGMIIIEQDGERRVEEFEMDGLHLGQIQCDVQDVKVDGQTAKIVVVINGERQEFEVPIPHHPMVHATQEGKAPMFHGDVPVLGEMFKVEKAGCEKVKSCNKDCDSCPGPNFY